ncbi:NUDIX hydrolase [Pukyongiella litopenaei]|uniref:NUDIX hydrolase n=1 Tax=Pukyongiella litopenaei TaxID=2605946 RepID=A0A2S0MR60_9RHOB|nr:NUDIX hydrolase [Pukyongiella litopenaei]AVO38375.1 NUDIX hydrolase [Pukyongiella litopenaei]
MTRRRHPTWPRLGALAVVPRNGQVLLVQRCNPPDAGLWGFPGGHVEPGETAHDAAARELLEETGVEAAPTGYLTNIDAIRYRPDGTVASHYLLAAVLCTYLRGEPVAADDVSDARWVGPDQLAGLPTSTHVAELAARATRALGRDRA